MLEWIRGVKENCWLGFDDGTLLYKVYNEGAGWGWEWEYVPDMDGMDGYDTFEEAKAAAEADYDYNFSEPDDDDDEGFDLLDLLLDEEDAYWDTVAHERMEQAKIGW
jgi:hypothetical protein